ncbi:MAG: LuxR C-terminal-related transcriptional regulator [Anaerolineae bacterium]
MSDRSGYSQVTTFVGRDRELAEVIGLLADPNCHLLTLVGQGGVGKTRLALEVINGLPEATFPDGIYVAFLQPLTSPDFILSALADALNFSLYGDEAPKTQLINYLRNKRLMLVLDNFEHLLDGLELLPEMLEAAPDVKLLVTSRERLKLREEWVFNIDGLVYPKDEPRPSTDRYEAVELFVQNSRRAGYTPSESDGEAIALICRLVEGVPLAIELAAAWTRILTCTEIAHEIEQGLDILTSNLRNILDKHRSMRVVFEHSMALLTEAEQAAFRRLSVFRGGFRREAAQAICGVNLDTLAALVDRSMLRVDGGGRYDLHELMRHYGGELLEAADEEAEETKDLHCSFYTGFMRDQWPRLSGSEIKAALTEISAELDNVRTAWKYAISHHKNKEIEEALRSLWFYYGVGIRYQEGVQIIGSAVPAFIDSPSLYGKLMARWGELTFLAGSPEKSEKILQESLRVLQQTEVHDEIAFVLYRLALLSLNTSDDLSETPGYLEKSLALYTELDDQFGRGEVLLAWGEYKWCQYIEDGREGALEQAQQYLVESLAAFQRRESVFGTAGAHMGLSIVAALVKGYDRAFEHIQISRAIFHDLNIGWGINWSLVQEGYTAYKVGDVATARLCVLRNLQFNLERGLGRKQYDAQFTTELVLNGLHVGASILMDDGQSEKSYELLGFISQQSFSLRRLFSPSYFFLLPLLDEDLPAHLAAAVDRGRRRDLESVVNQVISDLSAIPLPVVAPPLVAADLLTERELEILRLTADGLNSREVAERIYLSVTTVRWYVRQIYSKLNVHGRAELISRARELELLT